MSTPTVDTTVSHKGFFHAARRKDGFFTVVACGQRFMVQRGPGWSNNTYLHEDKPVTCSRCKLAAAAGK